MNDTLSVTLEGERLGRRLGSGGPALTIQDIQARDSVRGLERLSLCDWPGRMSAVLFFGGCNLRCPTCHNADLAWTPERFPAIYPADVTRFLKKRAPWLDGLVITGGEPTIVPGLIDYLVELAEVGLPVKLDTNGLQPDVVEELLARNLVACFAVDVKGPPGLYPALTGGLADEARARDGLERIFALAKGAPDRFYFRMTRVPALSDADAAEARAWLPSQFKLIIQSYVEPRRTHAQADTQEGRTAGNLVGGAHRPAHLEGAQGQWREGPPARLAPGPQGGEPARRG